MVFAVNLSLRTRNSTKENPKSAKKNLIQLDLQIWPGILKEKKLLLYKELGSYLTIFDKLFYCLSLTYTLPKTLVILWRRKIISARKAKKYQLDT